MSRSGDTRSHYRLVARLGGTSGEVWSALDTRTGGDVALKFLPPALSRDPERLERFRRDIDALTTCDHPNIARVLGLEQDGAEHFAVMELVHGSTLAAQLPGNGLPLERLLQLARPLVDAVHAAHERGVLHRALKPGNIMLGEDGRLCVLDFGLAEIREFDANSEIDTDDLPTLTLTLTGEGAILDALPYMSPEQIRGKALDRRSDVFSLGTILYEMATGQRAFGGETSADILVAVLGDQPGPVSRANPSLPPLLGQIVFHCLEKEPPRRFQSAAELAEALSDLAG